MENIIRQENQTNFGQARFMLASFMASKPNLFRTSLNNYVWTGKLVQLGVELRKHLFIATGEDYNFHSFERNEFVVKSESACATLNVRSYKGSEFDILKHVFTITLVAEDRVVEQIHESFCKFFVPDDEPTVMWGLIGSYGGIDYIPVTIPPYRYAPDEFYPYIPQGIENFFDAYMKSSSNVLVLFGAPGTGKTSALRNFIRKHNIDALITYDEQVISKDVFFLDFLMNDECDLIVLEDADTLLRSRETEDNKVMSKLLNASDGLVKLPDKKIVITANIATVNDIDSALIRPGRCFDVVEFRELTEAEAVAAAKAANIDWQPKGKKSYSLAELFNENAASAEKKSNKVKFGF